MGGFEVLDQGFLPVQLRGNAVDQRARRSSVAEFRGDLAQPLDGRDERIVVKKKSMTCLEHVAMQRSLVEGERIDGAQPSFVQLGVGRGATEQEIGQHEQQPEDDQRHSGRRAGHGWAAD